MQEKQSKYTGKIREMPQVANNIIKVAPLMAKMGCSRILDFGAGTFRNTRYLQRLGFSVIAVEKTPVIEKFARFKPGENQIISVISPAVIETWPGAFDAVVCTFVMNLLDDATNSRLVSIFQDILKRDGLVFVEVKEMRTARTSNGMTLTALDRLFLNRGFFRLADFRGRYSIGALYRRI